MAIRREELLAKLLNEPIGQLRESLADKAAPGAVGTEAAAVTAMRELAARYPCEPPNSIRFEMLLSFLLHDSFLVADDAREILAVIQDDSAWIYGGIMVAAHAGELAGEPWLREHYPKLPPDLQELTKMVLDAVKPSLGHTLAILS